MAPRDLNETHDPALRSFVASANRPGCDFPIQNLPFGVFHVRGDAAPARVGIAIGDAILDVSRLGELLGDNCSAAAAACTSTSLNTLMALPSQSWTDLRRAISALLAESAPASARDAATAALRPISDCALSMPVSVGDFTDFYASVFHATNAGRLIRPDNPLLQNYKYVPVAYHSRVSTIVASGAPVCRPWGQILVKGEAVPVYKPSQRLDYEAELGIFIGQRSDMGTPIPIARAGGHVFGYCLLNDWSARDIQAWEYQPLGPFLAKNFATSVSPWVLTEEALRPYRIPPYARPAGDPAPLPHLFDRDDQISGGLNIVIEASITSASMHAANLAPRLLGRGTFADIYWTIAQMIAHHSSNGCGLETGDLLGSGTVSGRENENWGSLLELSWGGSRPIDLGNGETRTFIQDGDEILLRGSCEAEGRVRLGFGECRTRVTAAREL